jgi:hypothetical protein
MPCILNLILYLCINKFIIVNINTTIVFIIFAIITFIEFTFLYILFKAITICTFRIFYSITNNKFISFSFFILFWNSIHTIRRMLIQDNNPHSQDNNRYKYHYKNSYLLLAKVCSNTNNLIINKRGFFQKNYFAYPTLSANPTTSLPLFVKEL